MVPYVVTGQEGVELAPPCILISSYCLAQNAASSAGSDGRSVGYFVALRGLGRTGRFAASAMFNHNTTEMSVKVSGAGRKLVGEEGRRGFAHLGPASCRADARASERWERRWPATSSMPTCAKPMSALFRSRHC